MINNESDEVELSKEQIEKLLHTKYEEFAALEADLAEKEELIARKDIELQQNQSSIAEKDAIIQDKNNEIFFMQYSKFWRLRNKYFKYKLNYLYPRSLWDHVKPRPTPFNQQETRGAQVPESKRFYPKVSIIVPNYNHSKFLKQRLDCIYKQTYENYEVLLLDDTSTDKSRDILRHYQQKYPKKTKCYFNKKNSGNVFKQWKRGISKAKGELIWIAESDDYCELNFLEELVKQFEDESVMLAYAHPEFVDNKGNPRSDFTFESYVSQLSNEKWQESYVETAHNEVNQALGMKNTIPNASGVVFRRIPEDQFNYDVLQDFKVCGDWYFYLSIIRGGHMAFVRETKNYYRFHPENTSTNYQKNIGFVKEHESIAKYIARNYKVPPGLLKKHMKLVQHIWEYQNPDRKKEFYKGYDLEAVQKEQVNRKPNILMGVYGFITGGGEMAPIRLANKLKEVGYSVTVFDYLQASDENQTIRHQLRKDIAVIQKDLLPLDTVLKEFAIELVHSQHANLDALFATRKDKNIPHVVTMHGMYEALGPRITKILEPAIRQVDFWVYTAEKNLPPLTKHSWFGKRPLTKIINGFDPPARVKAISRKSLGIPEDAFVLCLASRAIKEKGWREAMDAVRMANWSSPRPIVLLLVGDGPLYDQYKDLKDDHIRLLGFQAHSFRFFVLADMGLLPTTYPGESYPLVLTECLSVKKPAICTDVGEIRSMLTTDDGQLCGAVLTLQNGKVHIHTLAKTIARFANDQAYYNQAKAAAERRSGYFAMANALPKYEQVYRACLNIPEPLG